jgi:membrane associated rhomboid family serine protease
MADRKCPRKIPNRNVEKNWMNIGVGAMLVAAVLFIASIVLAYVNSKYLRITSIAAAIIGVTGLVIAAWALYKELRTDINKDDENFNNDFGNDFE